MFMTPEGAIVTRPASTVRAGEERLVAEALASAGVPILMSVHGSGTFEGADAIWVDQDLCFVAEGLRTNEEGANQVERMLREIGVANVVRVGLPHGAMHLDGLLAILDRDLAVVWPGARRSKLWTRCADVASDSWKSRTRRRLSTVCRSILSPSPRAKS